MNRRIAILTIAISLLTMSFAPTRRPLADEAHPGLPRSIPDWVTRAIVDQKDHSTLTGALGATVGAGAVFEANLGQFKGDASLIGRNMAGGTLVLERGGFSMLFLPPEAPDGQPSKDAAKNQEPARRLAVSFPDSTASENCRGQDRSPLRIAYFRGSDPKLWLANVPTFRGAICPKVFSAIDFAVAPGRDGFEYQFIVAPGGNADSIRMRMAGADRLQLDGEGALLISIGKSEIRHAKPVAFQTIAGQRTPVEAEFVLEGDLVRLNVSPHDRGAELIIDPQVTQLWASSLSGGPFGNSHGWGIAAAPDGSILETGSVNVFSSQTTFSQDAFMAARDPTGAISFIATFSGSGTRCVAISGIECDGADVGRAIAVGMDGRVYLTGDTTSLNFPILGAIDSTCGDDGTCSKGADPARPPSSDAFVLRLAPSPVVTASGAILFNGFAPEWGTYFGGAGEDSGNGIAVDASGTAFVAGFTDGDIVTTDGSSFTANHNDGFVVAYANAGGTSPTTLLFSNRIGGANVSANAVAVNASDVFVAGTTCSLPPDFKGADPLLTRASGGDCEAYVVRYDKTGARLAGTFLRGSGDDDARAIALDASGSVYVAGSTSSRDFVGASTIAGGGTDGFLAKLTYIDRFIFRGPTIHWAVLKYSLLFGGSDEDIAEGLAVDSQNRAYVVGMTRSANFPIVGTPVAPFHAANAGGSCGSQYEPCPDAFLLRVTAGGALDYSALWGLGGLNAYDNATAVALRADNDVVFTTEQLLTQAPIPQYIATTVRAVTGSDLGLAKSCRPNPVHAGSTLTCTMTFTNNGPEASPAVRVVDRPAEPAQFDITAPSGSPCQPVYDSGQRINRIGCGVRPLAPNSSAAVSDQLLPLVRGAFTDTATIGYADDWNPANNSATSTVSVLADTDLSAFVSHTPDPSPVGSDVEYSVWGGNQGPDVASGVTLTDLIPAGMDLISVTTPTGTCSPTQGSGPVTITCNLGILSHNLGPSGVIATQVTVVARPNSAGTYANVAMVTGAVNEKNPTDNQFTDMTNVVVGAPRIVAHGNLGTSRPAAGGGRDVTVEVGINNTGDGNARAVTYSRIDAVAEIPGGSGVLLTSTLPPPIPLLGPGSSHVIVANFSVPAGAKELKVTVAGTFMDFSGSSTPLPFQGNALLQLP